MQEVHSDWLVLCDNLKMAETRWSADDLGNLQTFFECSGPDLLLTFIFAIKFLVALLLFFVDLVLKIMSILVIVNYYLYLIWSCTFPTFCSLSHSAIVI